MPGNKAKTQAMPVTTDNFRRAESDMYFAGIVEEEGAFGKFNHHRQLTPIDKQTVIRANRDTLYSVAVFDLDAGPVIITMPDAGSRFMSLQVIDEDQYTPAVFYGAGNYTLSKDRIGTRYVLVALRTLVDPNDPNDVAKVFDLQDAVKADQQTPGRFEVPNWDQESQRKLRDALLMLGSTIADTRGTFGPRDQVDPVRHLIGTAMAWGGNPEEDALYLNVVPARNDGKTIYELTVKNVPVDGFWSISVYNADGYFEPNEDDAYTVNNITARKNTDGSVTVQFGGCERKLSNCLPIMPGWNYLVRLYRPHLEILDGRWNFPEAQAVEGAASMETVRKVA